jgi:hypothetical protein
MTDRLFIYEYEYIVPTAWRQAQWSWYSAFYRNFVFLALEVISDVHIPEPGSWLTMLQIRVLITPIS